MSSATTAHPCDNPECDGSSSSPTRCCKRCKLAWYCRGSCQKDHFPVHKSFCKANNHELPALTANQPTTSSVNRPVFANPASDCVEHSDMPAEFNPSNQKLLCITWGVRSSSSGVDVWGSNASGIIATFSDSSGGISMQDNKMDVFARVDGETNALWILVHRTTSGWMGSGGPCVVETDWMTFTAFKSHRFSKFAALKSNEEFDLQGHSFLCSTNSSTGVEELDEDCVRRQWLLRARILNW